MFAVCSYVNMNWLGRGPDRKFSGIVFNAGYAFAGAHTAQPRYSRRLQLSARERVALRANSDDGLGLT